MISMKLPFQTGARQIQDRRPKVEDGKIVEGEYEFKKIKLDPSFSPKPQRDNKGRFRLFDKLTGEEINLDNEEEVKAIKSKEKRYDNGKAFEVEDEDFVIEQNPGMFVKI